jgi:hypothetical protein
MNPSKSHCLRESGGGLRALSGGGGNRIRARFLSAPRTSASATRGSERELRRERRASRLRSRSDAQCRDGTRRRGKRDVSRERKSAGPSSSSSSPPTTSQAARRPHASHIPPGAGEAVSLSQYFVPQCSSRRIESLAIWNLHQRGSGKVSRTTAGRYRTSSTHVHAVLRARTIKRFSCMRQECPTPATSRFISP